MIGVRHTVVEPELSAESDLDLRCRATISWQCEINVTPWGALGIDYTRSLLTKLCPRQQQNRSMRPFQTSFVPMRDAEWHRTRPSRRWGAFNPNRMPIIPPIDNQTTHRS